MDALDSPIFPRQRASLHSRHPKPTPATHGFGSEHLTLLAEVFADVGADFGAVLTECNGEDEHVHLLPERRLLAQVAAAIPGTHPPRPPVVAVVLRPGRVVAHRCRSSGSTSKINGVRTN